MNSTTTSAKQTPVMVKSPVASPNVSPISLPASANDPIVRRHNRDRCERRAALLASVGDLAMIVSGFLIAYWLRYHSELFWLKPDSGATLVRYWKLILFGSTLVYAGLLTKNSCELKDLLAPGKTVAGFGFILGAGLFAFLGLTLVVTTNPPISRLFVVCAWLVLFLNLFLWRQLLCRFVKLPAIAKRLRRRLVVIGVGPEATRLRNELRNNPAIQMVGWVEASKPNRFPELDNCRLGSMHELGELLRRHAIDMAVLVESGTMQMEGISYVENVCEREHVQFKMVPHFFEILISGLRPSVVGGVPVLGVERLPLHSPPNRFAKRLLDIVGAIIGLTLSIPLILIFGALVFVESPGPIFYRQTRSGRNGRSFGLLKIRSMRINAEDAGKAVWTVENDPRRLSIGTFMRHWNIDEIPQFWNVLKGDMSLIGPRPERPELIDRFKFIIPHYQSRHSCRPGMSGWAQVNGLRGNTSLEDRIRYDIWYVENWSVMLDLRVMFLTFFNQKNAY